MAAIATPTFPTAAPLTTIWAPQASCATQIPTILAGGTCSSQGCTTYDPAKVATAISTWCAPPSTHIGDDFWYTSAKGCPSGYFTATSLSHYYTSTKTDLSILCCPSSYTSLRTYVNGGYACARSVTTPKTMSMVAWGTLYESNAAGSVPMAYGTMSPISTTVVQPTRTGGSRPMLYAEVVQMVVQSAGAPPISTLSPQSGSNGGTAQPFHLGPLNFIYSIIVLVAGRVFCLGLTCCCCYCACRKTRPVPTPYPPQPQQYIPQYSSRPYLSKIYAPQLSHIRDDPMPASVPAPIQAAVQECPHSISDSCRSSINKPCCACADKRTGKLSREARVHPYCIFCKLFWTTVPVVMCRPEWQLLGPHCAHNRNGMCEGERDSNSCCACLDKRCEVLDLDLRVSTYYAPCRHAWETKQPKDWLAIWDRPTVPRTPPVHRTPAPWKQQPLQRRLTPTEKPQPDPKELSKEVELSILSGVRTTPEIEYVEPTGGAANDGPLYMLPTFQSTSNRQPEGRRVPYNPKALSDNVGLSILSKVEKEAKNEVVAPTESNEDDGLRYGSPTLQVSPAQCPSQGWTRPPSAASASASALASGVSVTSKPLQSSQSSKSITERGVRSAKPGLLYTAPKLSVPEDPAEK